MTTQHRDRPGLSRRGFLGAAALAAAGTVVGCASTGPGSPPSPASAAPAAAAPAAFDPAAPPAQVAARTRVPVLCYHQLRDHTPADGAYARRLLITPPDVFRAHLDALRDGGWTTIDPDTYLSHLTTGAPLPPRPVMLSFDDSRADQVSVGLPELRRRGMTAAFFVMTIPFGKPGWMTRDDVRRVHQAGMTVGAHTYDHHRVDRYAGADWTTQLDRPREEIESIVGAPVQHFAYPFGAWSPAAFPYLGRAGYRSAFQLADEPADPSTPLFTLRRALVDSGWSGPDLVAQISAPI